MEDLLLETVTGIQMILIGGMTTIGEACLALDMENDSTFIVDMAEEIRIVIMMIILTNTTMTSGIHIILLEYELKPKISYTSSTPYVQLT